MWYGDGRGRSGSKEIRERVWKGSGWILDHALGKVWPRLEEVSFVTPSCEKGTSGCGSLLDDRPKEMLTDGHMVHTLTDKHIQ